MFLIERQLFVDSIRNIHEAVCACCAGSRHRWRRAGLLGMRRCIIIACSLTLSKLLLFYNNLCCVNLLTFSVCIASCLNTSAYNDADTLVKILLCKFCPASEYYTTDKISRCLSVTTEDVYKRQFPFS